MSSVISWIEMGLMALVVIAFFYPYVEYLLSHRSAHGMIDCIGDAFYEVLYIVVRHHLTVFLCVVVLLFFMAGISQKVALLLAIEVFQIAFLIHLSSSRGFHPMTNDTP